MYKFLLKILNRYIRGNNFLTRILFKLKVEKFERIYWDFTTLALLKCLKKCITNKTDLLEIGTGPYALLSIFFTKGSNVILLVVILTICI
jgi:hypothetical protein